MHQKFFHSDAGSILLVTALMLFGVIALLAVSVDLNRVQTGHQNLQQANDAATLGLAEYVMKGKLDQIGTNPEWRKWKPSQREMEDYARSLMEQNIHVDQNSLRFEQFDVVLENVDDTEFKVSINSCGLVEPTELAKAVGRNEIQEVCSRSSASFSFGEVSNTETAFIIDTSAAYSPANLQKVTGSAVDTTRFLFIESAMNDIITKYYSDPAKNNYAAFTGTMYPYYDKFSRKHSAPPAGQKIHLAETEGGYVSPFNGWHFGVASARTAVDATDAQERFRSLFPIFASAQELKDVSDEPPHKWPQGGIPNYWDRYLKVRNGYYHKDDTGLITYYQSNAYNTLVSYVDPTQTVFRKLGVLKPYTPPPTAYENLLQPDGTQYPAGLAGNIQVEQEELCSSFAYSTHDYTDLDSPFSRVHVQPLTKDTKVIKTVLDGYHNYKDLTDPFIADQGNPVVKKYLLTNKLRQGYTEHASGMQGNTWLYQFIHAWWLLSDKWQGQWADRSTHEKKEGVYPNRANLPANPGETSKHIVYIGSGIDMEGVTNHCNRAQWAKTNGGSSIIHACFCDFYMPSKNMTDDQFIEVCDKIKDSGIKIHIILQGFSPQGDPLPTKAEAPTAWVSKKISSPSLITSGGQPNDRRYRECASPKAGDPSKTSFYNINKLYPYETVNQQSAHVNEILDEIFRDEIAATAAVRLTK